MEKMLINDNIIKKPNIWDVSENIFDEAELFKFCRRISYRKYDIVDPIVRDFWQIIVKHTNHITHLINEIMPLALNNWRKNFRNEDKRIDINMDINLITSIRKWSKNIGKHSLDILITALKWADEKCKNPTLSPFVLESRLKHLSYEYDKFYVGDELTNVLHRFFY